NTYTGSTNLNGGTLIVPGVANGGLPSGIGASTSAATNLTFNGGSVLITALTSATDRAMTFTGNGGIALTTDNATLALNGALTGAGTLTFGLNATLVSSLSSYALAANNSGFTGSVTI